MNIHPRRFIRPALGTLCLATLATLQACNGDACFGVDACFNNNTQTVALSGTAATGGALASAQVTVSCVAGSATTLTDGGGNYRLTVNAALPCVITVTSGGTSLHSLAYAGGTFNTTPETELMLVYLAARLGTNTGTLIGNFREFALSAGDEQRGHRTGRAIGRGDEPAAALFGGAHRAGVPDHIVHGRATGCRQRSRRTRESRRN